MFTLDDATVSVIRVFSRTVLFGLPGALLYDVQSKYLANMAIVRPALYVGAISLGLNALFNYLFIYSFGFGFVGSPLATATTRTILPVMLFFYAKWKGLWTETWHGWAREAFTLARIKQFVFLGAPAASMIILEVGAFEITTAFVALLGNETVTR